MDVARLLLDCFDEELVHEPDDRRLLGFLGQLAGGVFQLFEQLDAVVGPLGDEGVDRVAADAQPLLDLLDDVFLPRQHRPQLEPGQHAELVERLEVERVVRGNEDVPVLAFERQERVAEDRRRRELRQELAIDRVFLELDVRNAQLVADGPQHVGLGDQPHVDGHLVDAQTVRLGQRQVELLAGQKTTADEDFTDLHGRASYASDEASGGVGFGGDSRRVSCRCGQTRRPPPAGFVCD